MFHTSLYSLTQPSFGHSPVLGPRTCTAGSIHQQKVEDLEVICALLTGTTLASPLTSCQSRVGGEGIRSSLLLEIVWVRKGVLSLRRTGGKTGSTSPTMLWPWLLGEGPREQNQRGGWSPCQQPLRHHWPLMLKSAYCNNPWSYRTDDFGIGRYHEKLKQHESSPIHHSMLWGFFV